MKRLYEIQVQVRPESRARRALWVSASAFCDVKADAEETARLLAARTGKVYRVVEVV